MELTDKIIETVKTGIELGMRDTDIIREIRRDTLCGLGSAIELFQHARSELALRRQLPTLSGR